MNYKNRKSIRLKNWDYRWDAAYFITINTKNHERFFGEIENKKMKYTPAGAIAYVLWKEIKNHEKNVELGEFVVMPNHIHGILILNGAGEFIERDSREIAKGDSTEVGSSMDVACKVPTLKTTPSEPIDDSNKE